MQSTRNFWIHLTLQWAHAGREGCALRVLVATHLKLQVHPVLAGVAQVSYDGAMIAEALHDCGRLAATNPKYCDQAVGWPLPCLLLHRAFSSYFTAFHANANISSNRTGTRAPTCLCRLV